MLESRRVTFISHSPTHLLPSHVVRQHKQGPCPPRILGWPRCDLLIADRVPDANLPLPDTSCILAWLIEQGYEVYAFMADVGQEEVCRTMQRDAQD